MNAGGAIAARGRRVRSAYAAAAPKRSACACGGTCPRCSGNAVAIGAAAPAAAAPASVAPSGSACGVTPSGIDLGPTNRLDRDGRPRKRPRLCRGRFVDTHLGLNNTESGLRGDNRGRIEVAAPGDAITAAITGCDPECLVFRQFVKVRTFEEGVETHSPLQSCSMQIPRGPGVAGFVEEQTSCFDKGTPGAGLASWHDVPGTRWDDPAATPTNAMFSFTVRVMIWDRCRGQADQTIEGKLVLRKSGNTESADVEEFHPVGNTFAFTSPKAKC